MLSLVEYSFWAKYPRNKRMNLILMLVWWLRVGGNKEGGGGDGYITDILKQTQLANQKLIFSVSLRLSFYWLLFPPPSSSSSTFFVIKNIATKYFHFAGNPWG